MTRLRLLVLLLLLATVLGGVLGGVPGTAAGQADRPAGGQGRVLILSVPRLTWAMVEEHRPPALVELFERSAVASNSPRTIGARTLLGQGYATIGAGNRATASELVAGLALDAGEEIDGEPAAAVYARRSGVEPRGEVLHVGFPHIAANNERLRYGAHAGALGAALRAAGRTAAVVANADTAAEPTLAVGLRRDAALAVVDNHGVTGGAVGQDLLRRDHTAPYGLVLDRAAVRTAFEAAWAAHDVVLLEASDLERYDSYSIFLDPELRPATRDRAIAASDAIVADALASVDPARDLVVVVAPAHPRRRVELTVAAVAGPGFAPGALTSGSTRRDGYVTLPDVAPTVLEFLGLRVPTHMTGAPMASAGGSAPGPATFAALADVNELAVFRNEVVGPVTVSYIVLQLLAYAVAVVALVTGWLRLRPVVEIVALTVLAVAPLTFLSGLFHYDRLGGAGYWAALFGAAALLAVAVRALGDRYGARAGPAQPLLAPVALAGLLLAVLLVDIVVGGPLQINTVMGYGGGPIVAGRFAGYGNMAWTLVATAALIVTTAWWGARRLRRPAAGGPVRDRFALAVIGGLYALIVLVIGLPELGLNVGGVLTTVPVFLTTALLLARVPLTWRRVVVAAAAPVVLLALSAVADLARAPEARTHLGRFVALAADQGVPGVVTVIERKLHANLSILLSSVWTLIVPFALAFIAFLAWRQPRFLRRAQQGVPGLRACLIGALVLGVLGSIVNDSGVAIAATVLTIVLPYVTVLIVRTAPP